MRSPLLEIRDLRTWFGTGGRPARAVDGVSLTVERGETVGLVGESGCGKTVTALSVLGLVPEPGRILPGSSIRLQGEELVGAPERRLRELRGSRMAMVFQEPATALDPVIPVGEQVAEGLRYHRRMPRETARSRARELLEEVGIPDAAGVAGAFPHQLSGGMRQRVVLAMALACEPALLLADEPTTALDVTVQARILELLRSLRERHRLGILLVTHDLAVVAEVCHRVAVMYAGQVVEVARVEELLREPRHPYTRALLETVPRADAPPGADRGGPLPTVPGTVPAAWAWPEGCRFAPRCPRAWDRCIREAPPLLPVRPGPTGTDGLVRSARCWLVEEEG